MMRASEFRVLLLEGLGDAQRTGPIKLLARAGDSSLHNRARQGIVPGSIPTSLATILRDPVTVMRFGTVPPDYVESKFTVCTTKLDAPAAYAIADGDWGQLPNEQVALRTFAVGKVYLASSFESTDCPGFASWATFEPRRNLTFSSVEAAPTEISGLANRALRERTSTTIQRQYEAFKAKVEELRARVRGILAQDPSKKREWSWFDAEPGWRGAEEWLDLKQATTKSWAVISPGRPTLIVTRATRELYVEHPLGPAPEHFGATVIAIFMLSEGTLDAHTVLGAPSDSIGEIELVKGVSIAPGWPVLLYQTAVSAGILAPIEDRYVLDAGLPFALQAEDITSR